MNCVTGRPVLLLLCILLSAGQLTAQYDLEENRVWAFGNYAGLNFTSGSPVAFRSGFAGGTIVRESNASVCDKDGVFLFCTNGSLIWDRANNVMAGANPLHPYAASALITGSTTQGAVIVPFPDSAGMYYVFSLTQKELGTTSPPGSGKLFYSVVDMNLNGGMGDVVANRKWLLLDSNLTEKMVAVRGTQCNVWLLVHSRDSNEFKAFEIARMGINPIPVSSFSGAYGSRNYWVTGEVKAAPNGKKLVACAQEGQVAELYDFNPASGIVSNALQLDRQNEFYGAAFSPDNSKVYVSAGTGSTHYILQYNLNVSTPAAIQASRIRIGNCRFSQLRLGPDGRIYFQTDNTTGSLGVIANPDGTGPACQFTAAAVSLLFTTGMEAGLPAEVVKASSPDTFNRHVDTVFCAGLQSMILEAEPGFTGYHWNDGTPGPRLRITQPGIYRVSYKMDDCNYAVDSFWVRMNNAVREQRDTGFCSGESELVLRTPPDAHFREWDDSSTGDTRTVSGPGTYWVNYIRDCRFHTDTFVVGMADGLHLDLGKDTVICTHPPSLLDVSLPGAVFRWDDHSTDYKRSVTASGDYWVQVFRDGCMASDTIRIDFFPVIQDLGPDTVLCNQEPVSVTLHAHIPEGGHARWSDGSTTPEVFVQEAGLWWVTVEAASCTGSDTILLKSIPCNCKPEMPSAFTPNSDGRNDIFRPVLPVGCLFDTYEMRIYNRWGQLVYRTIDPSDGWSGGHQGQPAEIGTYMYMVRFDDHEQKGDLTLIR